MKAWTMKNEMTTKVEAVTYFHQWLHANWMRALCLYGLYKPGCRLDEISPDEVRENLL